MAVIHHQAPRSVFPSGILGRVAFALTPGAIAAGGTFLFDRPLLISAAPLFAMGGFGVAALIMGLFMDAEPREQTRR